MFFFKGKKSCHRRAIQDVAIFSYYREMLLILVNGSVNTCRPILLIAPSLQGVVQMKSMTKGVMHEKENVETKQCWRGFMPYAVVVVVAIFWLEFEEIVIKSGVCPVYARSFNPSDKL